MYLKSIEVHGFKSFANKIVFDFHNGITGIVGPNGSGKSNVADAVRWVLGEQSARQLRGASMQDVIFAGTENRKPVSYAYVAITLDNADHVLPVDYAEVTVARRVYRSGESEYLLNGTPCRLKDVYELFYDTGIGKEGYSIIGQGQIERILSGRPEERRELFDEAAGIVKFKRRKATTQKKLERERENLIRIEDILSELERQVAPLANQAEKAKIYLNKKEQLKICEVNLFLLDLKENGTQQKQLEEKYDIAACDLQETEKKLAQIRSAYEELEQALAQADESITKTREKLGETTVQKGRLEGQINVLREQIHTAQMSREHYANRHSAIEKDRQERIDSRKEYERKKTQLDEQCAQLAAKRAETSGRLLQLKQQIAQCQETIAQGKNEVIGLLDKKASIKGSKQRFDVMAEQVNIRRAQLNQQKLRRKSEDTDLDASLAACEEGLRAADARMEELTAREQELFTTQQGWKQKLAAARSELEQTTAAFHRTQSRLESLRNIAERYDGYGNSIRRVMEKKEDEPKIHGVVADLIKVEKKYETAIETALGGSIQNIVTQDEETAKKMVRFLKENKYGRATFLPLTSVTGRSRERNERALGREGVIGMADTLVKTEPVYANVMSYLLGRVIVVDQIDHAVLLAREFHYSLHIVTLEGEHLSPGGSISGGAFKNNSNLLGRKRELDELQKTLDELVKKRGALERRIQDVQTAQELLRAEQDETKTKKQAASLEQNTQRLGRDRILEQKKESEKAYEALHAETKELQRQQQELDENRKKTEDELAQVLLKEQQTMQRTQECEQALAQYTAKEQETSAQLSDVQLEEAGLLQQGGFLAENLSRIDAELAKLGQEEQQLTDGAKEADGDVVKKEQDIEDIKKTIAATEKENGRLSEQLAAGQREKEELSVSQKDFFKKREELSEQKTTLDKEIFRLSSQQEKLAETIESQTDYMWSEYELTPHAAEKLRDEAYTDSAGLRRRITQEKNELRSLGDVNVNAIEEYKETSGRYEFLKGQRDDLIEAERTLLGIIDELDTGMRSQFTEKFMQIQQEFDKAFKELFGGGRGTLELVEDEDILECGIRIIAHPPGKKLQNMMQLSGGEKSLTAIALLFAIQNLKPSPFCLLDEIEAALDDSNVNRFAKYLGKLTKNTQFIVITHRRGTMAAADRLYGITMQEKGVSTLVSVSLIENNLT